MVARLQEGRNFFSSPSNSHHHYYELLSGTRDFLNRMDDQAIPGMSRLAGIHIVKTCNDVSMILEQSRSRASPAARSPDLYLGMKGIVLLQPTRKVIQLHAIEGLGRIPRIGTRQSTIMISPKKQSIGHFLHSHSTFQPTQPKLIILGERPLSITAAFFNQPFAEND